MVALVVLLLSLMLVLDLPCDRALEGSSALAPQLVSALEWGQRHARAQSPRLTMLGYLGLEEGSR